MSKVITKKDWLTLHGFNENGETYCVFGDDTYAIKDWLKEKGCKFDPVFKWHSPEPLDMPIGYGMFGVSYNDFMQWEESNSSMLFYEDAKARIEKKFQEAQGPSSSQYYEGEVGERVYNITAVFKSHRGFMGKFGYTNIYTFNAGDAVLVWFTATEQDIEIGSPLLLTFTIKAFQEFRGVRTTQITRAKIKRIE